MHERATDYLVAVDVPPESDIYEVLRGVRTRRKTRSLGFRRRGLFSPAEELNKQIGVKPATCDSVKPRLRGLQLARRELSQPNRD